MNGLVAGLVIHYENDSVSTAIRTIYSNQYSNIVLRADSARNIKAVTGFFSLNSEKSSTVLIDGIQLLRFHTGTPAAQQAKENSDAPVLQKDTLVVKDTADIIIQKRLSPQELRQSKPVQKKVNIKKR